MPNMDGTGPMGQGPGRIAKVTAKVTIGEPKAIRQLGDTITFDIRIPLEIDLLVDLRLDKQRFNVAREVALRATARVVGRVGPDVFLPRPRVDSALVEVVRLPEPATDADPVLLVDLVETAFNQRRKMLRRSLATRVSPEAFEAAGIDPADRPERLSVQDWGRLTHAVAELGPPAP